MRQRGVAVVIRNGRVLLVKDRGREFYSLPGGEVNPGEPTVSAAARELLEEVGLNAVKVTRMRACDFKGTKSLHKVCLVEAEGEPKIQIEELDDFIWWDMQARSRVTRT